MEPPWDAAVLGVMPWVVPWRGFHGDAAKTSGQPRTRPCPLGERRSQHLPCEPWGSCSSGKTTGARAGSGTLGSGPTMLQLARIPRQAGQRRAEGSRIAGGSTGTVWKEQRRAQSGAVRVIARAAQRYSRAGPRHFVGFRHCQPSIAEDGRGLPRMAGDYRALPNGRPAHALCGSQ